MGEGGAATPCRAESGRVHHRDGNCQLPLSRAKQGCFWNFLTDEKDRDGIDSGHPDHFGVFFFFFGWGEMRPVWVVSRLCSGLYAQEQPLVAIRGSYRVQGI